MKLLLAAINAKYIHSNLAVYSLRAYAKPYETQIELAEYTINHRVEYILRELYKRKPDVLCFSCYIWNLRQIGELITEIHKLLPQMPIWAGGPEVSYEPEQFLIKFPMVTGVMIGEGEETFRELCAHYVDKTPETPELIRGLVLRGEAGRFIQTGRRHPLHMDRLPFCYEKLEDFSNRILYYETSRGCPFSCSYCLSSIEKGLRFRSLKLVLPELQYFLDHQVKQVKFVDRTFNCSHSHAQAVWKYLKEHDNGITNFHFEISADLLNEEEIALISDMRPGLIQLEIGVQSTHAPSIREIHRTMNLSRLKWAVRAVQQAGNIHQHLDVIAGLPLEDTEAFQTSFAEVYRLKPEQLQLGFLKVLKGSYLYEHRQEYGLVYQSSPPYEVMATRWMSYDEILKIKLAEEMLEVYYNSGQFMLTMKVLELKYENPFQMYLELGEYYDSHGLFQRSHSRIQRCAILLAFAAQQDKTHLELYQETLTFDLYSRENMKSRPDWAPDPAGFQEKTRKYCRKGRMSHLEPFHYEIRPLLEQKTMEEYPKRLEEAVYFLFSYEQKNPLTGQAGVEQVKGGT